MDVPKRTKRIEPSRLIGTGCSDSGLQSYPNLHFSTFPFGGVVVKDLGLASLRNELGLSQRIIKLILYSSLLSCVTLAQLLNIRKP